MSASSSTHISIYTGIMVSSNVSSPEKKHKYINKNESIDLRFYFDLMTLMIYIQIRQDQIKRTDVEVLNYKE